MAGPAPAPPPKVEEQPGDASRANSLLRIVQMLALTAVAGLLGLLVWRVAHAGRGGQLVAEVRSGKKPAAPQFTLPLLWTRAETWPQDARRALGDGRLSLRELRGHPVVINFWASWCVPCKHEAPLLAASARAHAGKVAFLGIDVQDFRSDARKFLDRFDTPYVSVRAGGDVYDEYGLTGVPETYWLDRRGRSPGPYRGSEPPGRNELARFALASYRGGRVSSAQLRGKVVALTFLESRCKSACPIIAVQVARGVDLLTPAERRQMRAIAISTQPFDDTRRNVRRFLARRHAIGRLDYLLGTVPELRPVWRLYHILSALDSGDADTHSASVHIYDRDGVWVSSIHPGVDLTPENFAHDVRLALRSS